MNETVYCPKCREAKHIVECRHLASDAWQCPRCDFEFQLNIMPEVKGHPEWLNFYYDNNELKLTNSDE